MPRFAPPLPRQSGTRWWRRRCCRRRRGRPARRRARHPAAAVAAAGAARASRLAPAATAARAVAAPHAAAAAAGIAAAFFGHDFGLDARRALMPPLLDVDRRIFHSIEGHEDAEHWRAVAAGIDESGGFPDSLLFEAAVLQDGTCDDKSLVTFGQTQSNVTNTGTDCMFAEPTHTQLLFYRKRSCRRVAPELGDPLDPSEFTPRCLVLLMVADGLKSLFEQFLQQGRRFTPIKVDVDYMSLTAPRPMARWAPRAWPCRTSCSFSMRPIALGRPTTRCCAPPRIVWSTSKTGWPSLKRRSMGCRSVVPEPGEPSIADFQQMLADLQAERDGAVALLADLRADIGTCTPSETQSCGRTLSEAPHLWVAEDGTLCRGYNTFSAQPEDYCGRWSSLENVNAVDDAGKHELLTDEKPYCLDLKARPTIARCSRTARCAAASLS